MKKIVQNIPFLRLSVALVAGIITGNYLDLQLYFLLILTGVCLITLWLVHRYYMYQFSPIFGIGVQLLFYFLGIAVFTLHNKKPDFYSNGYFTATVLEAPVEKENSFKSLLKINHFIKKDSIYYSDEKVLVYFSKAEKAAELHPGNVISVKQNPQKIENNGNPFEFDYKNYLARKKIYRQIYLPQDSWIFTDETDRFSVKILAEKLRLKLLKIYRSQKLGENELEILSALTLGYKRELDPDTRRVFASAGAMHILAVSGLHVGIIYLILLKILGFLRKRKAGKIIFVFMVLTSLWIFAFVTGLSPSVSRAATMFTFFVIGNNLRRQVNIYNSLTGSALFLLLINPNNLFEVGFQLSYSAVFGIVFLQPKFEKLLEVKTKILRYFWQLLTVSVAAQIATFPFTAFYFNQFPTYFWISNLIVIPAVMVLIPLGISLLAFHAIPLLGNFISIVTNVIIGLLYQFLAFIETLPFSVQQFTLSPFEFACLAGFLISILILIKNRRMIYFKSALLFILLFFSGSLFLKMNTLNQKKLIVYNDSDYTIVHLISGRNNFIVTENPIPENSYTRVTIANTVKKLRLKKPVFVSTEEKFATNTLIVNNKLLIFEDKTILVKPEIIDTTLNFNPEIIVNPLLVKNLKSDKLTNSFIVSNKRYFDKNIFPDSRIHILPKDGAFIRNW